MAGNFTARVKVILRENGCSFVRQGRGDHEIRHSPINNRRFMVKSRHWAPAPSAALKPPYGRADPTRPWNRFSRPRVCEEQEERGHRLLRLRRRGPMLPRHSVTPHPHHRLPRNSRVDQGTILRWPCRGQHLPQWQRNEASHKPLSVGLPSSVPIDITNQPPPQVFLGMR